MNDETGIESQIIQSQPSTPHPVKQAYRDVIEILTEPKRFFSNRYSELTLNHSLALGIGVAWLGSGLEWLTRVVRHETLLDGLLRMRDQLQSLPIWKNLPADIWVQNPEHSSMFPAWIAELVSLALNPFGTLIRFFISGMILFMGAYLLTPKTETIPARDPVNLANGVKLVALASIPNLFGAMLGFLPFGLGNFLGGIYAFIVLIIGISVRFRVSDLRSVCIVLLPGVIATFALTCIVGVMVSLLFGTFAALFQVQ